MPVCPPVASFEILGTIVANCHDGSIEQLGDGSVEKPQGKVVMQDPVICERDYEACAPFPGVERAVVPDSMNFRRPVFIVVGCVLENGCDYLIGNVKIWWITQSASFIIHWW